MATFKVYCQSVRQVGAADPNGARSFVIGEASSLAYEGDAAGAVATLKSLGVGESVAVRHAGGIRSCMNKPALWAWIEEFAA